MEVPSFTPYLPRHEAAVFGAPNPARQDGLNFRSKGGLDRLGDTAITSLNWSLVQYSPWGREHSADLLRCRGGLDSPKRSRAYKKDEAPKFLVSFVYICARIPIYMCTLWPACQDQSVYDRGRVGVRMCARLQGLMTCRGSVIYNIPASDAKERRRAITY